MESLKPDVTADGLRDASDAPATERRTQQRRQDGSSRWLLQPRDDRRLNPGRRLADWLKQEL